MDTLNGNPTIIPYSGVDQTDSFGSLLLEYDDVDDELDAYNFMVYVDFNGLTGVGYYSQDDIGGRPEFVVPLILDYDEGIVIMAHSWGVHNYTETPVPAVDFNATFFALTPDLHLRSIEIENSTSEITSKLVYGVAEGKQFITTKIPTDEIGFLIISYKGANDLGSVILPWGIGSLGISVPFGDSVGSDGYYFVATELRQVIIDGVSYQVKLSVWSLRG